MKKIVSLAICLSMLCSAMPGMTANAEAVSIGTVEFRHMNVVGSQTCYADDTEEKTVTKIPNVIQGMRINQPIFRAYMGSGAAERTFTVRQLLKNGKLLKSEQITASADGVVEFAHVRNCEMIEILYNNELAASLDAEKEYVNGIAITTAPMSYQIYQRDENDEAVITIEGAAADGVESVSIAVDGNAEQAAIENKEFKYTKTLGIGLHDITVTADGAEVAAYERVGVGDIWVAAGQSNMTDMGAVTDGFVPDRDNPINENMHIMYAEDCTWHEMSHPSGEGRFFKTGVRTSPVTSFAREIAASENVPVGIVQSSVGGTNIYQWVTGVRDSDANSGYLFNALKACFDKMPSTRVKGILWYQGCNDAINENYAYNYKNLQQKVFDAFRGFFGENVPVITTQINDANQDSTSSLGYYDAWSYVKDVQRQNESLYDNVYVVGTGELELGDTIHNNAASNVKLGAKWARTARAVVYGDSTQTYRQAQLDTAAVTGAHEITLTFKDTDGLKTVNGTKRIGITNVSGGGYKIELGDLKKEFTVRKGASRVVTASNRDKGTEMTIKSAELLSDKKTVVLTTEEETAGVIAVDCMYGKRFTPTLVDAETNESVLAFYNVIAEYADKIPVTEAVEIPAEDTADLNNVTKAATDKTMYVNYYRAGSTNNDSYGLVKFDLQGMDFSKITSAKLAIYTNRLNSKDRSGDITISDVGTAWDNTAVFGNPSYSPVSEIVKINSNTSGVFPTGAYSAIDVTEYLRNYTGSKIGMGIAVNYAADVELAGVNSENPPKLIVQPGRMVTLTYMYGGKLCADMEVTIEASGATEYAATKHITDENGSVTIYLAEGSYKASTALQIGKYNASENIFTVTDSDLAENYVIEQNADTEPDTNAVYTFGDSFNQIKAFNTSALSETKIGNTGLSVSTISSNYNNVVIMNASTKTGTGYYPLGNALADNGFYLFLGAGGNSDVSAAIKFDKPIAAGKYVKITYAKPTSTNNGSTNRSAGNANTMTLGSEVIDIQAGCEFDKWYTTTVKLSAEASQIDFKLGKWSATAVSEIEVTDSADMLEFSAQDNISEAYITPASRTVRYSAAAYNSVTTLMGGDDIIFKGTNDENAQIVYSVNGYDGVEIDADGLLTITPSAKEGVVTVSAECANIRKELTLTLTAVSDANGVKIIGDELVKKGSAVSLKAIPTANGAVIPERATQWSIVGDNHGAAIDNGVLTVPATAAEGNIAVKATLAVTGSQVSAGVSDTFTVTIQGEASNAYEIKGVFLKNCLADISAAKGVDGIAVKTNEPMQGCKAVVKAMDENGIVVSSAQALLDNAAPGVSEVKIPLSAENATQIKAYIVNSDYEIISEEIYKTDKTIYKNIPLVSDWITGEKSGLGMGKGIISPTGAPCGVNPDTVDTADLRVKYTYDGNYVGAESDNVLWYKTGAFLKGNGSGNNSIYARDGADWEQKALPIGNGYMGGMIFGLPDKDQIQFNEETFWAAGYRGVQTSVNANSVNKNMSEGINGYMSVGNIFVDFNMPENAAVKNYYRDLNLDEAVAHVRYEYDGKSFAREYFASYPKQTLVFRYTGEDLNFDVNPVLMHPGEVSVKDGEITVIGKLKDSEPYSSGGNAAWNQESDLEYCAIIKVIADDGAAEDGYNTVHISGSTGVTILVAAATDYDKNQFEINADGTVNTVLTPFKSTRGVTAAIEKAQMRINGAAAISYDALKREHIADYKSQFDKVRFSLTDADEICQIPTDELQKSYDSVVSTKAENDKTVVSYDAKRYAELDKHLEELHYNYARYMMISSSRSDTMPATLQGKWCQSTAEIWGSCYCININMEMNYWFAGGANLTDSAKSLIGWFNSQIPAGRATAKNMYKVTPKSYALQNGKIVFANSADDKDDVFIMHTKQAIMGTTDMTGSASIQSAGNTAWLMYNLWDIYLTTGDKELLSDELYPIMRKAVNFYTQYMYTNERKTTSDTSKYPDGYYYTTWSGRSPEQGPTHEGIKYDLQLVAGMYDYTIAAAKILGVDADKVSAWEEIRNHLEMPVELGSDGQIKEWAEETSYNTDANGNPLGDPTHRHISHLVGLYPGTLINRDTPELLNGAKIVLENRGDDSTGWSCSNKFLLWARTLEGDKALELFRYQLAKKTYSNLFDTHSPFQIDGNFGSAAGVMELLMQSQTGVVYILPALPKVWDKGEICGIKAKNGAEVSIKWSENKADEIVIVPASDEDITIGYELGNICTLNGREIEFTDGKYTLTNVQKGMTYIFGTKITRGITELTRSSIRAEGGENDLLAVAGYDANGVMIKAEFADGLSAELSGYEDCAVVKAFLWDSLNGMRPYAFRELRD